ncbi:MAG: diacylglycerol kinase [Candidatus Moranbacteria bacterium]|nr:diacylglycerol kinase [Candidatus Moranbacteria bacterium]
MIQVWYKSVRHAFSGLQYAFRHEKNFRIECYIALLGVFLIIILPLDVWERVFLFAMIGWVLVAELANTIIERIVDILKPRLHPYARIIKDIMAATVLLSSLFALVIGGIILFPHIIDMFSK